MPEKPEVITVVKNLKPLILNKTITGCNVYWDNIIAYPTVDEFKRKIINQKINSIDTRGKFIVCALDSYKFNLGRKESSYLEKRDKLLINMNM